MPTRSLTGVTAYAEPHSRRTASGVNQSSCGPGTTLSAPVDEPPSHRLTGSVAGDPPCATVRGARSRSGTSSTSPAASRGGPRPASVSVERLPSTAGTSTPPATAR